MASLSESALRRSIKGGETSTVELKLAAPRPTEMAERLCGIENAQGGVVIIRVEDSNRQADSYDYRHYFVGGTAKQMADRRQIAI